MANYRYINEREIEYVDPFGRLKRACAYHDYRPILHDPKRERCCQCGLVRPVNSEI